MKKSIKRKCIEHFITEDLSALEIERNGVYEYYIEPKGYDMRFVFGVESRMEFEDLRNLYEAGYFNAMLRDIKGGDE